ncbi:MAG: hypothetical protein JO290_12630 [Sphingomonadaceae bacterium]|nr:hypothetical protein [Sphingomonadaceae bacterium]
MSEAEGTSRPAGDPTRVEGVEPATKSPGPLPAARNGDGHAAGTNFTGATPKGTETERDAPGISSDKRGDDVS